jgi:hypothetical protein
MAKAMMAVFADRCSRGHTTTYCPSMRGDVKDNPVLLAGVMTSAPARLPIHHVVHIERNSDQSAYPAKLRLPTPKVALVMVLGIKQISANLATPAGVSNVLRPSDQRLMK